MNLSTSPYESAHVIADLTPTTVFPLTGFWILEIPPQLAKFRRRWAKALRVSPSPQGAPIWWWDPSIWIKGGWWEVSGDRTQEDVQCNKNQQRCSCCKRDWINCLLSNHITDWSVPWVVRCTVLRPLPFWPRKSHPLRGKETEKCLAILSSFSWPDDHDIEITEPCPCSIWPFDVPFLDLSQSVVQKKQKNYQCSVEVTIWLFNIAMENHHL